MSPKSEYAVDYFQRFISEAEQERSLPKLDRVRTALDESKMPPIPRAKIGGMIEIARMNIISKSTEESPEETA